MIRHIFVAFLWVLAATLALVVTFHLPMPATECSPGDPCFTFAELMFSLISLACFCFGCAMGVSILNRNFAKAHGWDL